MSDYGRQLAFERLEDISKGLKGNPLKSLKATGAKLGAKSREKNYQRGFNQALTSRGQMSGRPTGPTLGSLAPGFKRSGPAYRAGQGAGAQSAARNASGASWESPFK